MWLLSLVTVGETACLNEESRSFHLMDWGTCRRADIGNGLPTQHISAAR